MNERIKRDGTRDRWETGENERQISQEEQDPAAKAGEESACEKEKQNNSLMQSASF
jgi:hypothetical protein